MARIGETTTFADFRPMDAVLARTRHQPGAWKKYVFAIYRRKNI